MRPKECIALILAGGQGRRLNQLTKNLAKPAVPFGGRYRIIDFTLSNCCNSHIDTIGVLTQYQPFELHSHVTELWLPRGSEVFILPPFMKNTGGEWYKGTANAVYQNMAFIERFSPRYVLILSGDHIYKMDYRLLLKQHQQSNAEVTISVVTVPWNDAGRFGVMSIDENKRITEFAEKPATPRSNLASMGIYVFNLEILKEYLATDERDEASAHDFGKNVIPALLRDKRELFAFTFQDYWMDVGTVESWWQANMDLLEDNAAFNLTDPDWPVYSADPVQPPQMILGQGRAKQSLIGEGCQVLGKVEHSILFPGVYVGPEAVVKNSVLMPDSCIGSATKVLTSIVGSRAQIEASCQVGSDDNPEITVVDEQMSIPANTTFIANSRVSGNE